MHCAIAYNMWFMFVCVHLALVYLAIELGQPAMDFVLKVHSLLQVLHFQLQLLQLLQMVCKYDSVKYVFLLFVKVCTEFMISPEDQTVAEGLSAVFSCQHKNSLPVVWRVNGTVVNGNATHFRGSILNGNSVIDTLKILANPDFNESIIQCQVFDGKLSQSAQLLIQG